MANIKSAIKRAEIAKRNEERNKKYKSSVKTAVKKVLSVVSEGKADLAAEELNKAYKIIDIAAGKGIIHKNNAARKKSRIAHYVQKLLANA